MDRVVGIFEGEKIDVKEVNTNEKKSTYLYVLSDCESIKMGIRDSNLIAAIKAIPNREHIKVKAEVQTFKSKLYINALEILKQKA